nr:MULTISPECIES: YhjD/YihY/BrkB family envelope integrity protein [unclassified Rhodococcus (in: high G+C Gram-positive bacteria)]
MVGEPRFLYYAAGITYFSVLALIPILMVVFAIAGFVLVGQPDLLQQLQDEITDNIPGTLGDTLNDVIDTAIASRTSVCPGFGWCGLCGAAVDGERA